MVCFHSALVPPYVRKSRSLEAALPWLYLKGISTGEMGEALKLLVGPDAQRTVGKHHCPPQAGLVRKNINTGTDAAWIRTNGCISGLTVSTQA